MYYYAMLNTVTRIVIKVFQTDNVIVSNDYIQLDTLDTSLVGKKYDEGTGNFVDPQPQDLKAHTTNEIAYKTQNKWLSAKLDEMDAAIASSGGGGSSVFEIADGTDSYKLKITDSTIANTADGTYGFAMGVCNTAHSFNTVMGKFAKDDIARGYQSNMTGDSLVIGNGTKSVTSGITTKSNGFRVTQEGAVYGLSAYNSSGADYAECFEWLDGNPNNEDRTGQFVTLEGDKIRIANAADYVLGVVTAHSSVIVEGVFVDNATDVKIADTEAEQKAFGYAYARGILKTLGIAPKDIPTANSTSDKLYRVQIGAFKNRENAVALKVKLISMGLTDIFIKEE